MFRAMARTIFSGAYARMYRAHWRFGLFIIYPLVLTLAWMTLGAAVGALCLKLVASLGAPPFIAGMVGVVTGVGAFASALWLTEPKTFLLYMCDDIDATDRFAHGERPDWHERMETFAGYVVDALRASDADEAIIVGHSSGSFLAIEVLDRALARDPALGRHGPRLRLLTLGANTPIIGFHAPAQPFRDRLRRLALAPDVDWVDYQSRHDIMNFWPFDPVAGHGIALGSERRNPLVVPISFRDLWGSGNFGRRRWRFFRAHFQFLMANERLGAAYDYYLICCGPLDLPTRATKPDEAVAAIGAG
jgi:pimeloyl-ACP methyl ester carboxylesterase